MQILLCLQQQWATLFILKFAGGWHEPVIDACDFYIDAVIFIFCVQPVLPAHDPIDKSC